MNSGIYIIINPKNSIYIGQSFNLKYRKYQYSKLNCTGQIKIYNSIKKYGWKNHKFKIIKMCNIEDLNYYERFYGERYNALSKYNLNLQLPESNDKLKIFSKETKNKIRISQTGKKLSKETRLKISLGNKGRKLSEEHKNKLKNFHIGKIRTEESKRKQSESRKGKYIGKNCPSSKRIGKLNPNFGRTGKKHPMSKPVICTITFKQWVNVKECALDNNIPQSTLTKKLNGICKNNTNFMYKENYNKKSKSITANDLF